MTQQVQRGIGDARSCGESCVGIARRCGRSIALPQYAISAGALAARSLAVVTHSYVATSRSPVGLCKIAWTVVELGEVGVTEVDIDDP